MAMSVLVVVGVAKMIDASDFVTHEQIAIGGVLGVVKELGNQSLMNTHSQSDGRLHVVHKRQYMSTLGKDNFGMVRKVDLKKMKKTVSMHFRAGTTIVTVDALFYLDNPVTEAHQDVFPAEEVGQKGHAAG